MRHEPIDPMIRRHNRAIAGPTKSKDAASQVPAPALTLTPTCAPASPTPTPPPAAAMATITAEAPGVYEVTGPGVRGFAHFDGKEWGSVCTRLDLTDCNRYRRSQFMRRMASNGELQVVALVQADAAPAQQPAAAAPTPTCAPVREPGIYRVRSQAGGVGFAHFDGQAWSGFYPHDLAHLATAQATRNGSLTFAIAYGKCVVLGA